MAPEFMLVLACGFVFPSDGNSGARAGIEVVVFDIACCSELQFHLCV